MADWFASNLAATLKTTFKVGKALLSAAGLTAPRTYDLPDLSGTVVVTGSSPTLADVTVTNLTVGNQLTLGVSTGTSPVVSNSQTLCTNLHADMCDGQHLGAGSTPLFAGLGLTGQLSSGQATGTPPFIVASTTVVANLNADMCDGQHLGTTNSPTFAGLTTTAGRVKKRSTITATTTLDNTYHVVLCNNSANVTVNLPAAASNDGREYVVKKVSANNNTVTIDPNSTETVDGQTTLVLYVQYDAVVLVSDGTNWALADDARRPHVCKAYKNAAQSITTSTETKVTLDTAEFDSAGLFDSTNSVITVKRAGKYRVTGQWFCSPVNANLRADVYAKVGTTYYLQDREPSSEAGGGCFPFDSDIFSFAAGDSLQLNVWQNSGASVNTSAAGPATRPMLIVEELLGA